jgi:hypothetical protein
MEIKTPCNCSRTDSLPSYVNPSQTPQSISAIRRQVINSIIHKAFDPTPQQQPAIHHQYPFESRNTAYTQVSSRSSTQQRSAAKEMDERKKMKNPVHA